MANTTIPNLPAAIGVNGTEQLYAVQAGTDVRITTAQLAAYAQASPSFPLSVSGGGTGDNTLAADAILYGNGTAPVQTMPVGTTGEILIGSTAAPPAWLAPGTTGQFLIANTGGDPTWGTVSPGASVSDIGFGSTGLTPSAQTNGSVTVAGTLNVAYGGTGAATFTANGLLYGAGTSAVQATAAWAAGDIFIIDSGGSPTWLAPGTSGQLLQSGGAGQPPNWTSVPGTGVATISFGSTGLTPNSATSGVVTVAGTLAVGSGGTGLSSISGANTALYSADGSTFTTGALPTAAGGTALTTFGAANRALYSTSSSVLAAGTLPVLAGGTGGTTSTGSGAVVLATSPTLTTPTATAMNGGSLAGLRNRIINGGMSIDQRNAGSSQTFTAAAALAYCVDRFYAYCTGANVTGQRVANAGSATSPSLFAYQFTGAASVTGINLAQRISAANSFDLAGQTVTLSVNLANSVLTTVTWALTYANTTDTFGTVASPTVTAINNGAFTVNSTMTRYSVQISVPSAATTGLQLILAVGAQTSGTWKIGNVQIECGGQATPFEARMSMIEQELCNGRYETSYGGLNKVATVTQTGSELFQWDTGGGNNSGTMSGSSIRMSNKAAAPTIVLYSTSSGATGKVRDINKNVDVTGTSANIGTKSFQWSATGSATQSGNQFMFHWTADCEL